jgi:hypothetical protein
LSKIARDIHMKSCIPNSENDEWIKIDTLKKEIVVKLD